ncbi:MAG: hypothetical protein JNM18_11230 [Planctomycetaceae bacterium]|nr:hypothetical protein [Planctomycetaceae bacterium]
MSRPEGAASTWPMLLALVALFALCLTAPRGWYGSAPESAPLAALAHDQGQPTLAPPKKKRQVVVGQDSSDLARRVTLPDLEQVDTPEPLSVEPLPVINLAVSLPRLDVQQLERLPAAPPVASTPLEQPYAIEPVPVIAYPEARIAQQPIAPAPSPLMPTMIHESREAAHDFVRQLPTMTAPVTDFVNKFTDVVTQDPLQLLDGDDTPPARKPIVTAAPVPNSTATVTNTPVPTAPAIPAETTPVTPIAQPELTATLPKRTELPLPPAAAMPTPDAIATPKIEAQPEANITGNAPAASATQAWWPVPHELIAQLDRLSLHPEAANWANQVRALLVALGQEPSAWTSRTQELLTDLADMQSQLNLLVTKAGETPLGDELRRTGYSLTRRLDTWAVLPQLTIKPIDATAAAQAPARLKACLTNLVAVTNQGPRGSEWRDYLLVDALNQLTAQRESLKHDEERALVQRVLSRVESGLKSWEQQYASATTLTSLREELRHWGHEQIDTRKLLADIEQFEQSLNPVHARPIAISYLKLVKSPEPAEQQLARQIETHYRNANMRLTFTADLVNRVLARTDSRSATVNDTVAGLPTRGWSRTHTHVQVRFIPDPTRVRMALEARGKIFSQTYTVSGPVTAHTEADSSFVAAKELQLDLDGFEVGETQVEADSRPALKRIQSRFDNMPFLSSLVQGVARNKYDEAQPQASAEAKRKIRTEVRTHIDNEISGNIRNGNSFFRDHVTGPLDELKISPHLVESQTTADRVTMRLRMATGEQLAGHGPRPRAPSNSLASMQMHESAMNNVLHQLGWNGKTYSLPELRDQIAAKLKTTIEMPDEENLKDLLLTFAPENSIRVRCRDGQLELNLALSRLKKGQQSWKDFQVRVLYKPDLTQPGAPLCRQGTVQLIGDRLNIGAQVALRGIFSKAFPPSRQMKLIPDKLVAAKPGLADVVVTQCELRDGWLGVALAIRPDAKQKEVAQPAGSAHPLRTGLLPLFQR